MGCRGDGYANRGDVGKSPRLAEVGLLCRFCFGRLRRDVADVPSVVAHLLDVGDSGLRREPGSGSGRRAAGSRVLYRPVLLEVDGLASLLGRMGLMIGDLRGVKVPGAGRWWRAVDGAPLGVRELDDLVILSSWIGSQLEWFATRSEVGPFRRDLGRRLAGVRARYPQEERSRWIPGVRCERCGQLSLRYYPPSREGESREIVCENLACGHQLSESKWSAQVSAVARAAGFGELDA
uniref:hypothetical protein n=1 Tax=Mobiluncus sp. TaxID=47293 RepID=UPI00258CE88C|nr:hypothetical protein [Mobiluncus sp.]